MLKVGMFIQNRYEIISRIGSGGMADVYKAKDHKLNRFVAVKVLKKEFRDDKVFISKFRVEAQSAAGLAHANIVNVYDVGEEAGIYYIVMELVEGITLKEYIKNKGRLSAREATSIALQISAGLEAAHNNGIIHRDVKPQNIIISTDGKVKVADFGIARAATTNTVNSSVMGSVHYSSPEQSRGGYSDEKSDIYSLGITIYEMLTGKVPFDGDTAVAVAIRHLQEEVPGPKELVPEIPYSTNQIVLKCTQKSPDRRYSNMTELIRDLRESLVNPEGDFVTRVSMDPLAKTRVISKDELGQINAESKTMPSYDESMDVGAAAGLHVQETGPSQNRAYQPGSYYQKSTYQEVSPGQGREGQWDSLVESEATDENQQYDPYFDAYENPDDYAIHEGGYRLNESFTPRPPRREDDDGEVGLNPKLERVVTIGGIIVAVIIGCVFLVLVANTVGLFHFGRNRRETEKQTEAPTETEGVQKVSVPELYGRSEADALKLLGNYGLTGKKTGEEESASYKAGEVSSQSPESGQMVEKGSVVEYKVVQEAQEVELPDLTNVEQSQAQAWLVAQGLSCEIDTSRHSDTIEDGHVITTEPMAGTKLKPGDKVTVFVSQGEEPVVSYVTPWDLTGYTVERANEALEMQDLTAVYEYVASNEIGEGLVARMDPPANQQIARGSTVTLYISTGPEPQQGDDGNITIFEDGNNNISDNNTGNSNIENNNTGNSNIENNNIENNNVEDIDANTAGAGGTAGSAASGAWRCDASLETPVGYADQQVRITLLQDGAGETTIFEGAATFPYRLQVDGAPGVTTGTAYVYLLDPVTGEPASKIEYPGIAFYQVN